MTATRLFVLGARGLLGGAIAQRATAGGVLARATSHAELAVEDTARVVDAVRESGASHVIVCAALPHVEGCERDPIATRRVNVDAVARLVESKCASVVAFSTEYVFDGALDRPYREDDATGPVNEYGRQKLDLERAVLHASSSSSSGANFVARVSGLYGPELARKNAVLSLWDRAARGESTKVANDQLITPTFTPSLASLVIEACAKNTSGILHLAGPEVLARDRFARLALEARGFDPILVESVPTSALGLLARRPRAGLDVSRAQAQLTSTCTTVRDGLAQLAAAERKG